MKKSVFSIVTICVLFLIGSVYSYESQKSTQTNSSIKEIETYLKTAEIVSKEVSSEGGRTAPWKIKLFDGKTARSGLFKYINRTRPAPLADSYKYEVAAYELHKLLDLNIVHPTVEREIEGIKGSLQLFIEPCWNETERKRKNLIPPDLEKHNNTIEEIKVFEILVHEEDCLDSDDTLVHKDNWEVRRVDFSRAFAPYTELKSDCEINRCSRKFYENLQKLSPKIIRFTLRSYLNKEEIAALLGRRKTILKKIKKLIKENGEDSILF